MIEEDTRISARATAQDDEALNSFSLYVARSWSHFVIIMEGLQESPGYGRE
jgi:hypothetical protein